MLFNLTSHSSHNRLFLQLAQFGAGLAAQPGGDLVGAIGRAAEKPIENVGFTLLDSPNSTSEITYKVQLGKGDGSYITYINRPATLDNQPYNTCGSSTLTVMEVAA